MVKLKKINARCVNDLNRQIRTPKERQDVLTVCNQPEYAGLPPSQIVSDLLDKKRYIASESSFYRLLKEEGQLQHRGRAKEPRKYAKPSSYKATQANQVWSRDITYYINKHSQLNFVSPAERHAGLDGEILQQRKLILEKARA